MSTDVRYKGKTYQVQTGSLTAVVRIFAALRRLKHKI